MSTPRPACGPIGVAAAILLMIAGCGQEDAPTGIITPSFSVGTQAA